MEEDLKCFEEEIRLSGYSDLLEKVRIERKRQKEQVKNKKRQEALIFGELDDSEEENEATKATKITTEAKENSDSSSEKEQQQQQQQQQPQKKRKPGNRNASNPKKPRSSSIEATRKNTTKLETSIDSDDETQMMKISRAERLLRRNKPNYVGKESSAEAAAIEEEEEEDEEGTKEDDNQGDDEAESEDQEDIDDEEEEESEHSDDAMETEDNKEDTIGQIHQNKLINSTAIDEDSSHQFQSARSSSRQSKPSSSTEQVYCTCNRVSFGEMIGCDAKDCPVEWFHCECVGLKSPPKGKWFCKGCQESMDAKTAAQLAVGISTRSSRRSG